MSDSRILPRFEQQICSQSGEDGAIHEIFRRIGTTNRFFVEFGVENGLENNTHYLLQKGWNGLWIEANSSSCQSIREGFAPMIADRRLQLLESFITRENIESLFAEGSVPKDLDLLSIDIDGNDYWVWDAIQKWTPKVIVIEYNAHFLSDHSWVMPYNPTHRWSSTPYYGASLKALENLGRQKGYALVGCSLAGLNAYFVQESLVGDHFVGPFSAEFHYHPLRVFLLGRNTYDLDPRCAIAGPFRHP